MKSKQKLVVSKKKTVASSSDEDSDVEKNFALLSKRVKTSGATGELEYSREEEEGESEGSSEEGEVEEASDDGDEEDSSDGSEEEGPDDQEEEAESSEASEEGVNDDDDDDEDDSEDTGGGSEIQTKEDVRNELSNMSFEDIMELQKKVGTKVYNEVAYGSTKNCDGSKKRRLNKNRPTEISSKRPAAFLRQVIPVKKPMMRDPRFDDLSGEYKPEIFEKTYKFINDIKHKEKKIIQKQLKKMKNSEKKEQLQFLLRRLENQERARLSQEQQRERELQFKREQRERANQGGRPFFLKKSDKKKLQLAEKYVELKKSGKLVNFLSKKRKRNSVKDRKKLPKQLQNKKAS